MERFAIAAFRSRQSVLRFDEMLRRSGINTQIITTPRAVSMGCGLSVRFDVEHLQSAVTLWQKHQNGSLIGFYEAQGTDGKIHISPVRV